MKKTLFTIVAGIYCMLVAISSNAQTLVVPAEVQRGFDEHFKNAQIARWVPIQNSFVASFTQGQGYKDAYFTEEGEFKGVGRHISIDLVPFNVQEKLNSYSGYELTELYQFDCVENGICFFAILKSAKNELVLKIDGVGEIAYSKKNKIKEMQKNSEPLAIAADKH